MNMSGSKILKLKQSKEITQILFDSRLQLYDLLLVLRIESLKSSVNVSQINIVCDQIMKRNPADVVNILNDSYPKSPQSSMNLNQFLVEIRKCFNDYNYLFILGILTPKDSIFKYFRTQFEDFYGLCYNYTCLKIQKQFKISQFDSELLKQLLDHYILICDDFKLKLRTNYKDILQMKTENLMSELIQQGLLILNDQLFQKFCHIPIEQLIHSKIIENNKLTSNKFQSFINENILVQNDLGDYIVLFKNACEQYVLFYNQIIELTVFGDLVSYVGWQTHWETVIKFVKSHIIGDSYQPFDLLCVMGGPKTGKTMSMYMTAVFMSYFVNIIRPQKEDHLFSQNITKIIQIDAKDYIAFSLVDKLCKIYDKVRIYIPQSQSNISLVTKLIQQKNIALILSQIEDMFIGAKNYFVVTWDEIQALYYVNDEKISLQDKYALGQFYKNVMVSLNSPCQHLMSSSISVGLLSILKAVPVNGRSICRCGQAIITSVRDSLQSLKLVTFLRNLDLESQNKQLELGCQALKNNKLSRTCANLVQIFKTYDLGESDLLDRNAKQLFNIKIIIAQKWIEQAELPNTAINQEVFQLINGSSIYPGELLIKLCYTRKEEGKVIFVLIDNSLKNAIQLKYQQQLIFTDDSVINQIIILAQLMQDCGTLITKIKIIYQKAGKVDSVQQLVSDVNNDWKQFIIEQYTDILKQGQEHDLIQLEEIQYKSQKIKDFIFQFYSYSKNHQYWQIQENCVQYLKDEIKLWNGMTREEQQCTAYSYWFNNGCGIFQTLRINFCHEGFAYIFNTTKSIIQVFGDQIYYFTKKLYFRLNCEHSVYSLVSDNEEYADQSILVQDQVNQVQFSTINQEKIIQTYYDIKE
ncbi:Hypothetical_protein [Hexamita inflata]|uniref:Hypothetical_protein n=1 Tax=Hexamita inflata TaxID=28002 RepID=A0AA86U2I6_9EUKA|nr:Hypothetical protein HINF_LOCUS25081 [Hexamita inflata]